MQLDPRAVTLWVGMQQHVSGSRFLLHELLAMQRSTARRHGRQACHVILRRRKGSVFTVTQAAVTAAHHCFTLTRRVVVAVAVTVAVPGSISIHVDLGPRLSEPVGTGAGVSAPPGTTGTPTMPDIVTLGTVMDEYEEAKSDGEGTIKAAEDHVQKVALRHSQCPKSPRGQEQEEGEGRRS